MKKWKIKETQLPSQKKSHFLLVQDVTLLVFIIQTNKIEFNNKFILFQKNQKILQVYIT